MLQIEQKSLSLVDFLQLPEAKPAREYINGEIISKPMPQGKHSIIQGELVTFINSTVKKAKIALAFPELRCTFGNRSIVPDVTVFSWERIPIDETGDIANVFSTYPNWTIEILSPAQNQTKVMANILHCLEYGSSLGWLIDPATKLILVFPVGKQPQLIHATDAILPVPDFAKEIRLSLGEIFDWLKL